MATTVELNNERITDPIDGLKGLKVTEDKSTDGKPSRKFTKELKFYGRGAQIIREEIINKADGANRQIPIVVYDDCCNAEDGTDYIFFSGVIRGDNVDWCEGDCYISATASEDTSKIDCLESTVIYDNRNGFQNRNHPRVTYCLEFRPAILHDLVILLGVNILVILLPFRLVLLFVDIIIKLIDKIPGVKLEQPLKGGLGEELDDFSDLIKSAITGCGRQHPSPLVREYYQNVCEICGLSYESSVLNASGSEYYNLLYLNAPVEKGDRKNVTYKEENAPILSGTQLLQQMNGVFNMKYIIEGSTIIQERRDQIHKRLGTWIDYQSIKEAGRIAEEICYSWNGEDKPAYGTFEYSQDATDWVGNEAKSVYNEIVEWNKPYSSAQKGEKKVQIPFSMARFRSDGIDRDVLDAWAWLPLLGNIIKGTDNALVMNNGTCFNPKLLIWDGEDRKNAFVKKFNGHFNRPMWFDEENNVKGTVQSTRKPGCGLYPRFWEIDNPRTSGLQGIDWKFSFYYTCEELKTYNINKVITIPRGSSEITSVEISQEDRIITVKGTI